MQDSNEETGVGSTKHTTNSGLLLLDRKPHLLFRPCLADTMHILRK